VRHVVVSNVIRIVANIMGPGLGEVLSAAYDIGVGAKYGGVGGALLAAFLPRGQFGSIRVSPDYAMSAVLINIAVVGVSSIGGRSPARMAIAPRGVQGRSSPFIFNYGVREYLGEVHRAGAGVALGILEDWIWETDDVSTGDPLMDDGRAAGRRIAGTVGAVKNAIKNLGKKAVTVGVKKSADDAVEKAAELAARRAATVQQSAKDGARRHKEVADDLVKENPGKVVQSERTLRDAKGNIVQDPVTKQARRVDQVVIDREKKTAKSYETTGDGVDKRAMLEREQRTREAGGTYIRDKETREYIPVEGVSEVRRKP
jgi:hypothetical protein